MSLKVYTGIKFKSKNIHEILQYFNNIKNENTAVNNIINYYCNNIQKILEFIIKRFDIDYINDLAEYINTKDTEQKDEKLYMKLLYDFTEKFKYSMAKEFVEYYDIYAKFVIHIIPYNGYYYGYYSNGDIKDNESIVMEIAEEFYYQNQTDKPDSISTREWNKRRKFWNMACYERCNEMTGLQFNIVDHNTLTIWDIQKIFDAFISKYELGYSSHFFYDTGIEYEEFYDACIIYREKSEMLQETYKDINIHRYDFSKGKNGNIIGEYMVFANNAKIESSIKSVSEIPGVMTTENEMHDKMKQVFVKKNS